MELVLQATALKPVTVARAAAKLRLQPKRKARRRKLAAPAYLKVTKHAPAALAAQAAAARLVAATARPLPPVPARPQTGARRLSATWPAAAPGEKTSSGTAVRADVQRERCKAKERVAKHKKKVEAKKRAKEGEETLRKAKYGNLDLDELREEAARRAKEATAKQAQAAAKLAGALAAKRRAQAEKRAADARARERRRAEIYALNHIMRDYFRGLGAVD